MKKLLKCGDRVRLKTFWGTALPSEAVNKEENFWRLVGEEGVILDDPLKKHPAYSEKGYRALVRFDKKLDGLGLINHNEKPNSIWIFISDLEIVDKE